MNDSQLRDLLQRVNKRREYIGNSLRNHVPINPLEEIYRTNEDLAKLIEHIQQFPQNETDVLMGDPHETGG